MENRYIIYRGSPRDPTGRITLKGYKNIHCGCTEWVTLTFRNNRIVEQQHHKSGCPAHESREISPLPNDTVKWLEKAITEYFEGKRRDTLRPVDEKLVGFYIKYYGNDNKFPQRAVLIKNGKVADVYPEAPGLEKLKFDDTKWCGHCIEDDTDCLFRATGEGTPPCVVPRAHSL